jgi:hypothetical protein
MRLSTVVLLAILAVAPGPAAASDMPSFTGVAALRANRAEIAQAALLGYAAPGDGGGGILDYDPRDSASPDNGGTVIVDASGHRFVRHYAGPADVRWFGIGSDGKTDYTDAFGKALRALSAAGGGTLALQPAVYRVGSSADLDLSGIANVTLSGGLTAPGVADIPTAPFTLLLAPSHTIRLGSNDALSGLRVARQGLAMAKTLRQGLVEIAHFAGTAITLDNVHDVRLSDLAINGFDRAVFVKSNAGRLYVSHVIGDDTNFLVDNGCDDTCTFTDLETWPFAMTDVRDGFEVMKIAGLRDAGGLIEVTLAAPPPTQLESGDSVVVGQVNGLTAANGRWRVTVVDPTHFRLDGSHFAGTYGGGGEAYVGVATRTGAAFAFTGTNGNLMRNLTDYGHDIKLLYGDGTAGMSCVNCWLDGDSEDARWMDPVPVGILYTGNAQGGSFIGGEIIDAGVAIRVETSSNSDLLVDGAEIGVTGCLAGVKGAGVQVARGSIQISGSHFGGGNLCAWDGPRTSPYLYVADGATRLTTTNVTVDNGSVVYQDEARDCPKYAHDGIVACAWSPRLAASRAGTVATPSPPTGSYTITGGTEVRASFDIENAALRGGAGDIVIDGLPIPPAEGGSCLISRVGGLALDRDYVGAAAEIAPGRTAVTLTELATNGAEPLALRTTNVKGAVSLRGVCFYRR